MEYLTIQHSDLNVSRLCMGGCPMGGHGWGTVSEQDLVDAVHTALDHEVNFFDTADIYGLGTSEEILGKALKGKRSKAVIASKFGVRIENGKTFHDNSPEWINTAIRGSLKRLNIDCIDLYQIHYRDETTPLDLIVETLDRLRDIGYIKYYGLSNIHSVDEHDISLSAGKFVSFQNEYSLAARENESDIMILGQNLQLTPLTWGSLGQGILSGKYNAESVFNTDDRRSRETYKNFHGDKLKKNMEIVENLRNISIDIGKSIPSIAIRFILDRIQKSIVLIGVKTPHQIIDNIDSFSFTLSKEQLYLLDSISRNM